MVGAVGSVKAVPRPSGMSLKEMTNFLEAIKSKDAKNPILAKMVEVQENNEQVLSEARKAIQDYEKAKADFEREAEKLNARVAEIASRSQKAEADLAGKYKVLENATAAKEQEFKKKANSLLKRESSLKDRQREHRNVVKADKAEIRAERDLVQQSHDDLDAKLNTLTGLQTELAAEKANLDSRKVALDRRERELKSKAERIAKIMAGNE